MKALRIVVSGRVQGVFFRAYAKERAERFGIKGTVANVNGAVEIVAEGSEASISEFIAAVRKGPPASRVKKIQITDTKPQFFDDFQILR